MVGADRSHISRRRSRPSADCRHGFVTAWVGALVASYAGPGSFIGRLITGLGTSLGLNIEPSSTAAYLIGLAIILGGIFLLGLLVESGLRSFISDSFAWLMMPPLRRRRRRNRLRHHKRLSRQA